MALILQIETATASCSVALSENGHTISCKELNERNVHASHITLFIENVLKQADVALTDLNAVAVSMGPGSYTGLRIGISAAKGICYALDIPLISIQTLQAMAVGVMPFYYTENFNFCPMIDARRMEVYTAVIDKALNFVEQVEARVLDSDSYAHLLEQRPLLFFGDGAEKCRELFSSIPTANFHLGFVNSAAHFSNLAFVKYQANCFEDLAYCEPFYLKDFVVTQAKRKT